MSKSLGGSVHTPKFLNVEFCPKTSLNPKLVPRLSRLTGVHSLGCESQFDDCEKFDKSLRESKTNQRISERAGMD